MYEGNYHYYFRKDIKVTNHWNVLMVAHAYSSSYSGSWGRKITDSRLSGRFSAVQIYWVSLLSLASIPWPSRREEPLGFLRRTELAQVRKSMDWALSKWKLPIQYQLRKWKDKPVCEKIFTRDLHTEFIKNAFNNKMKNSPI